MIASVFITGCVIRGIFAIVTFDSIRKWKYCEYEKDPECSESNEIENKYFLTFITNWYQD